MSSLPQYRSVEQLYSSINYVRQYDCGAGVRKVLTAAASNSGMRVEFHFYATLRDAVDEKTSVREFEAGTTIAEALRALTDDYEKLHSLLFRSNGDLRSHVTVSLNGEPLMDDRDDVTLSDGDTLILSPGVAGGMADSTSDPGLDFELGIISLGNRAFEGNNNSYLLGLEADAETTLVDTGVAVEETERQLRAGLDRYDLEFADIDRIFLTHHHADHTGLAGDIQAESGCEVFVHVDDAPVVEQRPEAMDASEDRLRRAIDEWGMPEDKQEELLSFLDGTAGIDGDPPEVTTFEGGETFDLGSVELEAVHMPGHAAGLAGFAFDGRDGEEVFSGDALLPYYTPNVGGADTRVEGALAKYLDTLSNVVERGYTRAWPGHRGPIIDPPGRAADIIVHHRERTERVLSVLEKGPATPWEVSAELFGSLSYIHILHGPGEAFAHLEHLAEADIVRRDGHAFELISEDPNLDVLFPDISTALDPANQPNR
jgi:glyoxylase-like metal-dependent hydrolase (beta-lactamase superfamily II)/molybdopterin converting factor small subunit